MHTRNCTSPFAIAHDVGGVDVRDCTYVQAAATVVSIGIDGSFEGENGDYRAFAGIDLPGAQAKLVETVAAAAPHPIIVRTRTCLILLIDSNRFCV